MVSIVIALLAVSMLAVAPASAETVTPIYDIQGGKHLSPLDGEMVTTTGVVTAVDFGEFYLQDPDGDGDDNTSDGILVDGSDMVEVGQEVNVTGVVVERSFGSDLSTTTIVPDSIELLSSGNDLPSPVAIGKFGRIPPAVDVISESELPTDLQVDEAVFNPDNDGIDFYEAMEGMRVKVHRPIAVSATRTFNPFSSEVFVLPTFGKLIEPADARTRRGGILLQPDPDNRGDQNPERVQIQFDGDLFPGPVPALNVGANLDTVTGVMGYSFGNFEVNATETFDWTPSGKTPQGTDFQGDFRRMTVASYNVLNLSPDATDDAQRATVAGHIVDNLNQPDIVALQEIQDDSGEIDDGTTSADLTLAALVDAIVAAGGPEYRSFDVAPADGSSGGVPGGNIRNAYLYNPDRVDLAGFASLTPEALALGGVDPSLTGAFAGTRTPLLASFVYNGQTVTVINNHLTSRFGSTPVFGAVQPFVQAGETEREAQVGALNDYVDNLLADDAEAKVMVLGDLNTFEWTNDLTEILPGPEGILTNLIDDKLVKNDKWDKYSFIFEGNSQMLDHVFVTDGLFNRSRMDIVHANVDFPRVDPSVGSDHEPLLTRIRIEPPFERQTYKLQLLHASDLEGGVDALDRAANFAAIVDNLEDFDGADASVTISAGDNWIPSPFFNAAGDRAVFRDGGVFNDVYNDFYGLDPATGYAGLREGGGRADVSIMNVIEFDASAIGNHEFDIGTAAFAEIIGADTRGAGLGDDRWVGAQFPYVSSNLDFSGDEDLSALFTDDVLLNTNFKTGPAESLGGVDAPKIAPSTVIDLGKGERLGVVGATTPLIATISSPGAVTPIGPTSNDMPALAAVIQPAIDALTDQGIDKIVVTSHLQQLALEEELMTLLSGVDISIAGGSDSLLANPDDALRAGDVADEQYPVITTNADGDPTVVVSTDGEYSYVGRLFVEFNADGVLKKSGSQEILDSLDDLNLGRNGPIKTEEEDVDALWGAEDPFAPGTKGELVQRLVTAVEGVVIEKDSNVVGETDVFLEGRRENVRTQETNLGNLGSDANLFVARSHDPSVAVSLKNGGGLRAEIGEIINVGNDTIFLPPQANPLSGKEEGQVSQLDIENSLRFNNGLTLLTLTAAQMAEVLEHAVAATEPGDTPGQFAQVGGVEFSYDPTATPGDRIRSAAIVDDSGAVVDVLVSGGDVAGDAGRAIRIVTLNFLVGGGDSYPYPDFIDADPTFADRVDLVGTLTDPGAFGFADPGSEQDAFAEFMNAEHGIGDGTPFADAETDPADDERIQDLSVRSDTVIPPPPT